jgi:hypothetical protein
LLRKFERQLTQAGASSRLGSDNGSDLVDEYTSLFASARINRPNDNQASVRPPHQQFPAGHCLRRRNRQYPQKVHQLWIGDVEM